MEYPCSNSKLIPWPEWLVRSNPDICTALEEIDKYEMLLRSRVSRTHEYKRISQIQVNQFKDAMIAKGIYPLTADGKVVLNSDVADTFKPNPAEIALHVYNYGQTYHLLYSSCFSSEVKVLKLFEGVRFGFASGNLLVAFSCVRAVIEHMAHHANMVNKLDSVRKQDNLQEALKIWEYTSEKILKAFFATRIEWEQLFQGDSFSKLRKKDVKYEKSVFKADIEADSILNAIDEIDIQVPGLRVSYEVLCEFVHPNVGSTWAITENVNVRKDRFGINWQIRKIGFDIPYLMIDKRANLSVLKDILQMLTKMVHFWYSLVEKSDVIRDRILHIVQLIVKDIFITYTNLFQRNDECPCGSGLKVKKCCGK